MGHGVARHQPPRPITPEMRACWTLVFVDRETRASVAKLHGVSVSTLVEWLARVEDEKRMARR
jgi:hypothetical protein